MYDWFGYVASVIVAVSLMMSSIIKLRWYNLIGAACFSIYGFLIGAMPVGVLNGFIAIADIYYLVLIYKEKDSFTLMETDKNPEYLKMFLEFYESEIQKFFPSYSFANSRSTHGFFILRNTVPAGVVLGDMKEEGVFEVKLDFATPQYRDFKLGKYIFLDHSDFFHKIGCQTITALSQNNEHDKYLEKMGFIKKSENSDGKYFEKKI